MSWLNTITKAVAGTAAATAAITALPVLGAAGSICALGSGVAAVVGTSAAVADKLNEDTKQR